MLVALLRVFRRWHWQKPSKIAILIMQIIKKFACERIKLAQLRWLFARQVDELNIAQQ